MSESEESIRRELEVLAARHSVTLDDRDLAILVPFYRHSRAALAALAQALESHDEPAVIFRHVAGKGEQ